MSVIRVNFTLPEEVYSSLVKLIPSRERSSFVSKLLARELKKKEDVLYNIATKVEKDSTLREEMSDWDNTLTDGLEAEEWK